MFINLTNHRLSEWEQTQLQAAQQYGTLIDMPFPPIAPSLTGAEVGALAETCYCRINELLAATDEPRSAVHLAGELVFCFKLATILKRNHITVITSTTERNVWYRNEVKVSDFQFVSFREY